MDGIGQFLQRWPYFQGHYLKSILAWTNLALRNHTMNGTRLVSRMDVVFYFLKDDLENIMKDCKIKPAVDQVLCHISNTPLELIDYCKKLGLAVEAYSPVAHGAALNDPVIEKTAAKYGVSKAQLCIRYDWQLGTIVLPKTASPEHMKSNADIDFTISDDDMETLKHLEKIKDYGEFGVFPVYGGKI